MNNQFCKVFDVQGHQVLYRTDNEDADGNDEEAIVIITVIGGLYMSASMTGFERNNTSASESLKKVDQAQAENFFNSMLELTK